ncbi:MAG: hypothetical protein J6J30_04425 [Clostridia bacterium]|nr:hypothetical protein [Clostridia bacterium]
MTNTEKYEKFPNVNGKRRKIAELLVNPDCNLSIKEMCEQVGVSRNTFYRWQKEPAFHGYVNFLIDSYTDSELANAWKALIRRATNGNTEALKLFFELKGKYKQEVTINKGVVFISGEDEIPE